MKDEHDKSTQELLPPQDPLFVAQQRARLLMDSYLPVSMVARDWAVSPRRVRALLLAGRLAGRQQENGYWEVLYPYTVTEGRRGPQMRRRAPKKPELRLV
jgi:hypothetical protein